MIKTLLTLAAAAFIASMAIAYIEYPPEEAEGQTPAAVEPAAGAATASLAQAHAEPIKAEILSSTPSAFTIDVGLMANADADTDAELFAVYVSDDEPRSCADFSNIKLSYAKPEEHHRLFDLSQHQEVIEAINTQGCIIIPNTPAG